MKRFLSFLQSAGSPTTSIKALSDGTPFMTSPGMRNDLCAVCRKDVIVDFCTATASHFSAFVYLFTCSA